MKQVLALLLFIIAISTFTTAQTSKLFSDGPVWNVQYIKTKPGMQMMYLKNIGDGWVKLMKEAKAQGLIMDYKIFSGIPGSKDDWDLMLLDEVKNHAAEDGLSDKLDMISEKLFGGEDGRQKAAVSRNDLREVLGGKMVQELMFK